MEMRQVNPPNLAVPVGYSYAVEAKGAGRVLLLGGIVAMNREGAIEHPGDLVAQFDRTLVNLVTVLQHAGAGPDQVARMRIYCPDRLLYQSHLAELGRVWRRHFGRYYPAMTFIEVKGLFDPAALVEVEAEAYLP